MLNNFGAATNIALRSSNQDRFFANARDTDGVFVVADGMGGLDDGHVAAEIALECIKVWWAGYSSEKIPADDIPMQLMLLMQEANQTIFKAAQERKVSLGTTCSLLLICGDVYFIAHVGDSRVYFSQKKFFKFLQNTTKLLTFDHTWANEKRGKLTDVEISIHPKRNMLTSCLGVFEEAKIFISSGRIEKGVFVVCSDGMYRSVEENEMAKLAAKIEDCGKLAEKLVNTALENGAKDNSTAVVVRI